MMIETMKMCLHITKRNWQVYRKDLLANTSPTVADPALIMISLGLGLGVYLTDMEGMSYLQYLAPGLVIATALFTSFFESSYGFYIRMTYENIYKAMLTTPVSVREIILGEFLWVGLKGAIMAIGVSIVLALFGLMNNPFLIPLCGIVGFLVAVPCGAIGLISSAIVRNINQFQTVYSFVIAPLFYLSGIFFPLEQMARPVRFVAELFPVIHGVQLSQAIFWNEEMTTTLINHGIPLLIQLIIFCSIANRLVRKKLII